MLHLGGNRLSEVPPCALGIASLEWLHLGANLGDPAARYVLQASSAALLARARAALDAEHATLGAPARVVGPGEVPGGEARTLHAAGACAWVSLLARGAPKFHRADDGAARVDVARAAAFARAAAEIAVGIVAEEEEEEDAA